MTLHSRAVLATILAVQRVIRKRRAKRVKVKQLRRKPCCGNFRCHCGTLLGDPKDSAWWHFLQHPDTWRPATKHGKAFRRRYRVPRGMFEDIVQMWKDPARNWQGLAKDDGTDARGR